MRFIFNSFRRKVLVISFHVILIVTAFPYRLLSFQNNPSKIPGGISGIILGENIESYGDRIFPTDGFTDPEEPYLTHFQLRPEAGYKMVTVSAGNCLNKGVILKIKVKYSKDDEVFFKQLKKGIEQLYGKPLTYEGDPFHLYQSWKWRFNRGKTPLTTMSLQRYTGNDEDRPNGIVLKLNFSSKIEEERECYRTKTKPLSLPPSPPQDSGRIDYLIPIPMEFPE